MKIIKNSRIFNTDSPTIIRTDKKLRRNKKRTLMEKPFETLLYELRDLWSTPNDLSDDSYTSIRSRINSHKRGNYSIDFSQVSPVNTKATQLALKHLEIISLIVCHPTAISENLYSQVKEEAIVQFTPTPPKRRIQEKQFDFPRPKHSFSEKCMERAEITFFNDLVSISINLIKLEPRLEDEVMRYLKNLIPIPLYDYYLSQKGQSNVMKPSSPTQKLREMCQNYLEMSIQTPPAIHRASSIDQEVVGKLEQLINETKQAKRMTFKTAEEIKQVVLEASGVEEESATTKDRDIFMRTVIELYDSMFHLVRMFKANGNEELFTATSKELKRMELLLQEIELEAIETIGEKINPAYMQGVAVVPSIEANGLDQYVVFDEIRKGFKDIKEDRIIREAQVITVLN